MEPRVLLMIRHEQRPLFPHKTSEHAQRDAGPATTPHDWPASSTPPPSPAPSSTLTPPTSNCDGTQLTVHPQRVKQASLEL
ncbi:hypothetical protein AVEN_154531-1 [Araneus ventricosus]|uniref:Uncharacterized protein n=1 Tax=Araneus ventricosus TaxID=182803 RepID=A0A4Y2IX69_ARAVE|nr:hypothetical protein AVEN_154531-1 [Araneus ventricosus]